jgi:hypothetical protein
LVPRLGSTKRGGAADESEDKMSGIFFPYPTDH